MESISTSSALNTTRVSHLLATDSNSITKSLIPGQKYIFTIKKSTTSPNNMLAGYSKLRTYLGVVMLEGREHVEVERVACKAYLIPVSNIESIAAAQ